MEERRSNIGLNSLGETNGDGRRPNSRGPPEPGSPFELHPGVLPASASFTGAVAPLPVPSNLDIRTRPIHLQTSLKTLQTSFQNTSRSSFKPHYGCTARRNRQCAARHILNTLLSSFDLESKAILISPKPHTTPCPLRPVPRTTSKLLYQPHCTTSYLAHPSSHRQSWWPQDPNHHILPLVYSETPTDSRVDFGRRLSHRDLHDLPNCLADKNRASKLDPGAIPSTICTDPKDPLCKPLHRGLARVIILLDSPAPGLVALLIVAFHWPFDAAKIFRVLIPPPSRSPHQVLDSSFSLSAPLF